MPRRRDQQKSETRDLVVEAARALFEEKGWEAATTRDVAARAGVAVGTVFAHFPDKRALLAAALHDQVAGALAEAWATLPERGVLDQLLHVAGRLYASYRARPTLSKALVAASLFETRDDALSAQLAAFHARVGELVAAGVARGELRRDLDPALAAQAYFALYFAVLVAGLRGDLPPEAQGPALAALVRPHLPEAP